MRKGEGVELVRGESAKELFDFRTGRFDKQKQWSTSYSMRNHLWGEQERGIQDKLRCIQGLIMIKQLKRK